MRLWKWLEHRVGISIPLALAVLYATWVSAGLDLLALHAYAGHEVLSGPAIALVWLTAFIVTRVALRLSWSERVGRLIVAGAGLLTVTLLLGGRVPAQLMNEMGMVSRPVVRGAVVAWLWWRGIVAGRHEHLHDQVHGAFTIGVGWWIVILLGVYATDTPTPGTLVERMLLFAGIALAALAVAALRSAQAQEQSPDAITVNRYWLALIGVVIAGILILGVAVSAIVTPEGAAAVLRWTWPLLDLLARVLYVILLAMIYLVLLLTEPLIRLLRRLLQDGSQQPLPPPPDTVQLQRQLDETMRGSTPLPSWVEPVASAVFYLAVVSVIAALFALAFRQMYRSSAQEIDEEREVFGSWGLLGAQLSDLLRRLRTSKRHRRPATGAFLPLDDEDRARRRIRRVYQGLLGMARRVGRPRPPRATPHEYAEMLAGSAPEAEDSLETLTDLYVLARYAARPLSAGAVERAEAAWQTIRARLVRGAGEGQDEE